MGSQREIMMNCMDDLQDFIEWYSSLNPQEEIDLHEVYTIFFNQETYIEAI